MYDNIRQQDPAVYDAMMRELQRQRDHIELIASENFVSPAVMEAMGSHLTNKYAEGYPGARYYGSAPRSAARSSSSPGRARTRGS